MIDEIVNSTLILLDKQHSTKISPRGTLLYGTLLKGILSTNTVPEAAAYLNVTYDALTKYLVRYVYKEFPDKPTGVNWKQYILSINGYKQCNICKVILPISDYVKSSDNWDGLAYGCRACKAIKRAKFTENNPDYSRLHYLDNRSVYLANSAKYRASLLQATPIWSDTQAILGIYASCPNGYHVDHIYPLQSDWVCGLHVPTNLRCIPAKDNLVKGNRYVPILHGEVI